MGSREMLVKKIEELPPYLLEEVANYLEYIQFKAAKEKKLKVTGTMMASEKSLARDWLKSEEDDAWADL